MAAVDLEEYLLQKKYDQFSFLTLLDQLFPRGPLWRFDIIREGYVEVPSITSAESFGTVNVTHT